MPALKLHAYQEKAVDFWLKNETVYYAVDTGRGKTVIALKAIEKIGEPALILGPIRPIYDTWPVEIEKWGMPFKYTIIHRRKTAGNLWEKHDLYLANFESLKIIYEHLIERQKRRLPMPFSTLVIDEGSMIKDPKRNRFDFLCAIRNAFKYVAILSGTPAPNTLANLWSQYRVLDKGQSLGLRHTNFIREHFEIDPHRPYDMELKPGAKEKIFEAVAPKTFRIDSRDYSTLPPIVYNKITLGLPKKIEKIYAQLKKESVLLMENTSVTALNAASLSMKLRQVLQGFVYGENDGMPTTTELHKVKLNALKALIEETNQPILCAIQFKYEKEMILREFPGTPVIAGGTKNEQATQYINDWNLGNIPLLICHPASMSHGINLQFGGNIILWYCLTWSCEQWQQFNARLHRQGQKNGVVVHSLVIKDTIDERVVDVLKRKETNQQELLDFLRDLNNY